MKTFNDVVILFTVFAFIGWIIESVFVSILEKKIVNTGFLHGFFCPIYGFGGILIIIAFEYIMSIFSNIYLGNFAGIIASILLVTILEYITGYMLEKVFHCKWWDYSNDFANLHGYICLKNSLIWGTLAILLVKVEYPFVIGMINYLTVSVKFYISTIILAYFIFDTSFSVIETLNLRKVILKYANIPINIYKEMIIRYKRFFHAFPHLLKLNAGIINRDVRSILNERIKKVKDDIKSIYQ